LELELELEVELQYQVRPMTGHSAIERVIAISDIHDCATAPETLVKGIDPQPEDTTAASDHVPALPEPRSRSCAAMVPLDAVENSLRNPNQGEPRIPRKGAGRRLRNV
jgi:hypothetical protein